MKKDMPWHTVELEQGGSSLRRLASCAHAAQPILLTLNGHPYAAIIAPDVYMNARAPTRFLALRGTGKGFWGASPEAAIAKARGEWD